MDLTTTELVNALNQYGIIVETNIEGHYKLASRAKIKKMLGEEVIVIELNR